MKIDFEEEKEKQMLKKTLSYYRKISQSRMPEENANAMNTRRTVIIAVITTIATIGLLLLIKELFT